MFATTSPATGTGFCSAIQRMLRDLPPGPSAIMIKQAAERAKMPEPEHIPGAKPAIVVRFGAPVDGDVSTEKVYLIVIRDALERFPNSALILDCSKCGSDNGLTSFFASQMGKIFNDLIAPRQTATLLVNTSERIAAAFSSRIEDGTVIPLSAETTPDQKAIVSSDLIDLTRRS